MYHIYFKKTHIIWRNTIYIRNIRFIQLIYRNNKNIWNIHQIREIDHKIHIKNRSYIHLVEVDGALQYNWL